MPDETPASEAGAAAISADLPTDAVAHSAADASWDGMEEIPAPPAETLDDLLAIFAKKRPLQFFRMPGCEDAKAVHYSHEHDAGMNIYPYFKEARQSLAPGAWAAYRTGTGAIIPAGTFLSCHPRSGMARDLGITILNAPGTIDSSYQGEILLIVVNHSKEPVTIERDRALAQLVWLPVLNADPVYGPAPTQVTTRAAGGLGSTG